MVLGKAVTVDDPLVLLAAFALGIITGAALATFCRGRVQLYLAVAMKDGQRFFLGSVAPAAAARLAMGLLAFRAGLRFLDE